MMPAIVRNLCARRPMPVVCKGLVTPIPRSMDQVRSAIIRANVRLNADQHAPANL